MVKTTATAAGGRFSNAFSSRVWVCSLAACVTCVGSFSWAQSNPPAPPPLAPQPVPVQVQQFTSRAVVATAVVEPAIPAGGKPANFATQRDAKGYAWDVTSSGVIGEGASKCFDGALKLTINGADFNSQQSFMEEVDGSRQLVLQGKIANINITRRIWLDRNAGGLRYIETLENTNQQQMSVLAMLQTRLGSGAREVTSDTGRNLGPRSSAPLKQGEKGLVIVQAGATPGVVMLLSSPTAENRPLVNVTDNQEIAVAMRLSLEPGETISVAHLIAQRRGLTTKNAGKTFDQFFGDSLKRPRVTSEIAETIANFDVSVDTVSTERVLTPLLAPVEALAASIKFERGDKAAVMLGEDEAGKLVGAATGEAMVIQTAFGEATVDFEQVAALVGGGGKGMPMQLFLRTGEILAGDVTAPELKLTTGDGLALNLDPAAITLLITERSDQDARPPNDANALIETGRGDRLAASLTPDAVIEAATSWGRLKTTVRHLQHVSLVRQPYPAFRLTLTDHTRVTGMLHGSPLTMQTLRFGEQSLPIRSVRELQVIAAIDPAAGEGSDDAAGPPTPATLPAGTLYPPYVQMMGGDVLAGRVTAEAWRLIVDGEIIETPADQVKTAVQVEADDARAGARWPSFKLTLHDGKTLIGKLEQRMMTVQGRYGSWRAPAGLLLQARYPNAPADHGSDDQPTDDAADQADDEPQKPLPPDPPARIEPSPPTTPAQP